MIRRLLAVAVAVVAAACSAPAASLSPAPTATALPAPTAAPGELAEWPLAARLPAGWTSAVARGSGIVVREDDPRCAAVADGAGDAAAHAACLNPAGGILPAARFAALRTAPSIAVLILELYDRTAFETAVGLGATHLDRFVPSGGVIAISTPRSLFGAASSLRMGESIPAPARPSRYGLAPVRFSEWGLVPLLGPDGVEYLLEYRAESAGSPTDLDALLAAMAAPLADPAMTAGRALTIIVEQPKPVIDPGPAPAGARFAEWSALPLSAAEDLFFDRLLYVRGPAPLECQAAPLSCYEVPADGVAPMAQRRLVTAEGASLLLSLYRPRDFEGANRGALYLPGVIGDGVGLLSVVTGRVLFGAPAAGAVSDGEVNGFERGYLLLPVNGAAYIMTYELDGPDAAKAALLAALADAGWVLPPALSLAP